VNAALRCYVAAPYLDGTLVREQVHPRLAALGIEPTSSWCADAIGAEDFAAYGAGQLRAIAATNDADLARADVVLVIAREGAGGEMFAEARLALVMRKPVVWTGRLILSAWRRGVVRVDSVAAALRVLARYARRRRAGSAQ